MHNCTLLISQKNVFVKLSFVDSAALEILISKLHHLRYLLGNIHIYKIKSSTTFFGSYGEWYAQERPRTTRRHSLISAHVKVNVLGVAFAPQVEPSAVLIPFRKGLPAAWFIEEGRRVEGVLALTWAWILQTNRRLRVRKCCNHLTTL